MHFMEMNLQCEGTVGEKKGLLGERWFKPTSATEKSAQNSCSADAAHVVVVQSLKSCLTLLQPHGL